MANPEHSNVMLQKIADQVAEISKDIERTQIADYVNLINKPWSLIKSNLISGIARGVGFAIGFTIFTATIFYLLQKLGALNLPIVGDYIAQLVEIVRAQLEGKRF